MLKERPLTAVLFSLHVSAEDAARIVQWLALDPKSIPSREGAWGHVRRSEDGMMLVFGPAGLKRVRASQLIDQLTDAGFRYGECTLAVKPAVYTKTHERRALRAGRTDVREGQPVVSENPNDASKLCLEIGFAQAPELGLAPPATLLGVALSRLVWKRGRVILLRSEDGTWGANIELSQPKVSQPPYVNELGFHPVHGFHTRILNLP